MKKLALCALALLLTGAVGWNRTDLLYWLYFHIFSSRQEPVFLKHDEGSIKIFYVRSDYLSKRVPSLAKKLSQNVVVAEKSVGVSLKGTLKVYLYNNWEEKGNHINDIRVASANVKQQSLHCIVNDKWDGTLEGLEYQPLLQQKYGTPGSAAWGEYIAAALSGVWNQKSLQEWAGFLLTRGLNPSFPLFLTTKGSISEYFIYPWNALFARFVLEKYGWNALAGLYGHGKPPDGYAKDWNEYVRNLDPPAALQNSRFPVRFQRGISYAYTNSYDAGYATKKSKQSLQQLVQAGVEWVAAIPYGYMRKVNSTQIHAAGHSIIGESDESMIALAEDAQVLGLKILMKPQIWIDHDSWPGKISVRSLAVTAH